MEDLQLTYRPLTTAFTRASECDNVPWRAYDTGTWVIIDKFYDQTTFNTVPASKCLPESFSDYGHFSPGMCPYGFTTGWTSIISKSITAAECCPSGFVANNNPYYIATCESLVTAPIPGVTCKSSCSLGSVGPGTAREQGYIVFYQSSDLSLFPTFYTPGVALVGPTTAKSSGVASPSGSTNGTIVSEPAPLSTGARAGIGIGIAVLVIAGVVGAWFLIRKHRRSMRNSHEVHHTEYADKPELEGSKGTVIVSSKPYKGKPELYSSYQDGSFQKQQKHSARTDHTELPAHREGLSKPMLDHNARELDNAARAHEIFSDSQSTAVASESHHAHTSNVSPMTTERSEPQNQGHNLDHHGYVLPGGAPAEFWIRSTTGPQPHSNDPVTPMSPITPGPAEAQSPSGLRPHVNSATSSEPTGDLARGTSTSRNTGPPAHPNSYVRGSTTIEDLEIQYLEQEEQRIRERKAALMKAKQVS